jgi:ferredoxin
VFKQLNKQGVQSNKGFIVQFVGRFEVEYREGEKLISVYVEPGYASGNKFCVIIAPEAFSKWDDGTVVSSEKQKEILKNFTEAMEFQNIGVVIE